MNVLCALEFRRRWQPDALALSAGGRDLTWVELDDRTARIAGGLAAAGVEPGDRVGLLAVNSPEWCELALAVLRVGAVLVPMNVRATARDLGHIVATVGAARVAVDATGRERLAPVLAAHPHVTTIGLEPGAVHGDGDEATLEGLAAGGEPLPVTPVAADAAALVPFTGGTTGHPKGVTLTHGNVRAMAEAYAYFEGMGAHSVSLCFAPLAFNGGVTNALLGSVLLGGRLILEEFDPALALRRVVEERVTVMTGVPLMYESIAALGAFADADLSSVATALTGGAVVADGLLRTWAAKGVALRQSYGLTEATGPTTVVPRERFRSHAHTVGVAGPWDRVRVVDDHGVEVATGEAGEIVVSGPQVMAGYWADPAATAAVLRDGWLHTGDVGRVDDDGFLSIVDRKRDMIITGGINVYPAEVERVLRGLPGVLECVAFGVPHERWGETVAVAIRRDPDHDADHDGGPDGAGPLDVDEVERVTRAELAAHMVPRWIRVGTDPLPRSGVGKLLRRAAADAFDPALAHRTSST